MPTQRQVWDIYIRLFHWLLVLGISYQWVSMEVLDDAMENHALVGYGLLALLLWRIIWGFVGPASVRFSYFLPTPKTLICYLQAKPRPIYASHNPLGSLAVFAFLSLIIIQVLSGLFMTDDIFFSGPLLGWLDKDLENWIQGLHDIVFELLVVLIVVHIVAVLWHVFQTEPYLITAMVDGKKPQTNLPSMNAMQIHCRAIISLGVAVALVYICINYLPEWLGISSVDDWDF